jgi:hypothetical protein
LRSLLAALAALSVLGPAGAVGAVGAVGALGVLGSGGCSVDAVRFSPPADAPLGDASGDATPDASPDAPPQPRVELCAVAGDEDGNGAADCRDPACIAGVDVCAATATCNTDCTMSRCGDSKRNPAAGEECDRGTDDTATCDGDCTLPQCNDGRFNPLAGEERDPPMSPASAVPVNPTTCRYDFSGITQLYCTGACGAWGGGNGCQQADADAFCKLKTGNPAATAAAITPTATMAAAGICCPTLVVGGCILLGKLTTRGVALDIYIHNTDLATAHTGGQVIANPTCIIP